MLFVPGSALLTGAAQYVGPVSVSATGQEGLLYCL